MREINRRCMRVYKFRNAISPSLKCKHFMSKIKIKEELGLIHHPPSNSSKEVKFKYLIDKQKPNQNLTVTHSKTKDLNDMKIELTNDLRVPSPLDLQLTKMVSSPISMQDASSERNSIGNRRIKPSMSGEPRFSTVKSIRNKDINLLINQIKEDHDILSSAYIREKKKLDLMIMNENKKIAPTVKILNMIKNLDKATPNFKYIKFQDMIRRYRSKQMVRQSGMR